MTKGAICKLVLDVCRVKCAAYLIQLCVEDDLKMNTIEMLLGACWRLVTHFKHGTIATGALVDRQKRSEKTSTRCFYQVE